MRSTIRFADSTDFIKQILGFRSSLTPPQANDYHPLRGLLGILPDVIVDVNLKITIQLTLIMRLPCCPPARPA
jgi:hypothetical protein